jgi:hypothetical protein
MDWSAAGAASLDGLDEDGGSFFVVLVDCGI